MNKSKLKRIGLVGIYHESNTFLNQQTEMHHFVEGHMFFGEEIISQYQDAFHEIGGIIEILRQQPVLLLPVMYAEATPGGIIERATSEALISRLMEELNSVLPLDGLIVVPHGAAVSEIDEDFDGYWLSLVRDKVGDIPMVGTLDPHANLSHRMVEKVDAFIAYKTNPHIDQRNTGKAAVQLMLDLLYGDINPTQRMKQARVAISIEQQNTSQEPCLGLYRLADKLSKRKGVLSISILLGYPYADVPDMGCSSLVVTDNNPKLADDILQELDQYLLANHQSFSGEKISMNVALRLIDESTYPVLLLDMGDNIGGGSPGDGTLLLNTLESVGKWKFFVCINDPDVVNALQECTPGQSIKVRLGAKIDDQHGSPVDLTIRLKTIVDGKFSEAEPRHGGQVNYDMGPTAIVETLNGSTIMITSRRTAPFSLQQLLGFQINPLDFQVIVAKGVNAPIAAYASVCPTVIQVNTPGVTMADMKKLAYKNRRVPLFPFETDLSITDKSVH